jgi:hypothetical protein
MNQSNKPEPPSVTAAQLLTILSLVRESGHTKVHYVGHADKSVILGLAAALGTTNVSIMDMHDRWGREAVFFWDEEDYGGLKPPSTPDWLEGIRCYFEGTPDHEVFLYDHYWTELDDFLRVPENWVKEPPKLIVLFGDEFATQLNHQSEFKKFCLKHPLYKWRSHEGVIVGKFILFLENEG